MSAATPPGATGGSTPPTSRKRAAHVFAQGEGENDSENAASPKRVRSSTRGRGSGRGGRGGRANGSASKILTTTPTWRLTPSTSPLHRQLQQPKLHPISWSSRACRQRSISLAMFLHSPTILVGTRNVTTTETFDVPPAFITLEGTYIGPAHAVLAELVARNVSPVCVPTRYAIATTTTGFRAYQYADDAQPNDSPLQETVEFRMIEGMTMADALNAKMSNFKLQMADDGYASRMVSVRRSLHRSWELPVRGQHFAAPPPQSEIEIRTNWSYAFPRGNRLIYSYPSTFDYVYPHASPFTRVVVSTEPGQQIRGEPGKLALEWCLYLKAAAVNDAF
ncbi:hypothetical protein BC828DRAFT_276920 [Blastocladiella britannica]|nr:hypothetical protein BC828DRAFT_276920 [Blastocladiella britannica]